MKIDDDPDVIGWRVANAIIDRYPATLTDVEIRTIRTGVAGAIKGVIEAERKRYVILKRQITVDELAGALLEASKNPNGCCICIPLEIKP